MTTARAVGAALRMQLRSHKRSFASAASSAGESPSPRRTPPKKRVQSAQTAASRASSASPTRVQSPVSTLQASTDGPKVLYDYASLVPARLIRRYKRFLADVVLLKPDTDDAQNVATSADTEAEDEVVTVYCPNTGPMVGLLDEPNARVQLSRSDDPKRKYAYTLEMIRIHNGEHHVWVGVHSASANRMVEKALESRWFPELGDFDSLRREVKFAKNSRVDFVLTTLAADGSVAHEKYVEVKSVTLALDSSSADDSPQRCAVFPDTVSTRAQKHVTEFADLFGSKAGSKKASDKTSKVSGAIVFLVQRDDCHEFAPSIQHDQKFAELCALARKRGIQVLAYSCRLEPNEAASSGVVRLLGSLPLQKGAQ